MISVPVFDSATGSKIEVFDFPEERLGSRVQKGLLREAILMYEANQHQGTSSTKTRAFVSGSNRKPWRQKGTGRARAGHKRSPIWRGGAVVHGPQPRNRKYKISRDAKRRALKSALLAKCQDGEVLLIDRLDLPEAKTKRMIALLDQLKIFNTALIVSEVYMPGVWQAGRNIPGIIIRDANSLNAYEVLAVKQLVLTRAAFRKLLGDEAAALVSPVPEAGAADSAAAPAGAAETSASASTPGVSASPGDTPAAPAAEKPAEAVEKPVQGDEKPAEASEKPVDSAGSETSGAG